MIVCRTKPAVAGLGVAVWRRADPVIIRSVAEALPLCLSFSDKFVGDGRAFFQACAERGLEGIVSKQASAPYRSGRTRTWLKTKCFAETELVIIGTDRDRKTGATRALLAKADGHGLSYAGAAFIG